MRVVIPQRMVLRAAIVPKCDRVGLPVEAAVKFRRLDVATQQVEQRIAFELAEPVDPGREIFIDEERLAAGHRMRAHDRVLSARKAPFGDRMAEPAVIRELTVMRRGQPLDEPFDRIGEAVIGGIHAGKERVSAARRGLDHIEDAAHRRGRVARHIGMPLVADDDG